MKELIKLAVVITGTIIFLQGCSTTSYVTRYEPVTVGDIVQMSKDSVPPSQIIKEIKKSHTAYKLTADQLAKLEKEGVSPDVVNYMEETHLEAVRENQYLEDDKYWWPGWDGYYYGGPAFGWPYGYWNWNWGDGVHFEHDHDYHPHHVQGRNHQGREHAR